MRGKRGESPLALGLPELPGLTCAFVNADGDLTFRGERGEDIDPERYQPPWAPEPVPVPEGKFHNQRVYHWRKEGITTAVYGLVVYDSLSEAAVAFDTEPYVEHPDLMSAVLIATITVKQGVTDLAEAMAVGDAQITQRPRR